MPGGGRTFCLWWPEQGIVLWHAFDIIADALEISPALRTAKREGASKVSYSEHVVRWFSDKSGKGQWPAVVDDRPGMTIQRGNPAPGKAGRTIKVVHTRHQTIPVSIHLDMTCGANPWRSPLQWKATETLGSPRMPSELRDTVEHGKLQNAQLTRRIQGAPGRAIEHTYAVSHPGCIYSLLADFPAEELKADELQKHKCDAFFTEGMLHAGEAAFVNGSTGNADEHKLAKGLACYRLLPTMGFPLEFWVNQSGVVVYVFEAATRAWALESVEGS